MKMSELRENPTILEWLDNLGPGENTQRIYLQGMQAYTNFTGMTPEDLRSEAEDEISKGILPSHRKIKKHITPEMVATNGAIVGNDVIKNRQCISSDPDVHARFTQRFIDAGFNRLYFHSAGPDQYEFIEDYARDVLPIIRERNKPVAAAIA